METNIGFLEKLLCFPKEWKVIKVQFIPENHQVHVYLDYQDEYGSCTRTGERCKGYDKRSERCWEHLDVLQYKTFLPRVRGVACLG
jgi:hypothetical protein